LIIWHRTQSREKDRHRIWLVTDVGVQKITSLQRCVARAREAYAAAGPGVRTNYNLQDAAILNVIRACDAAIDLANMAIRLAVSSVALTVSRSHVVT
jgi:hypothetical protein